MTACRHVGMSACWHVGMWLRVDFPSQIWEALIESDLDHQPRANMPELNMSDLVRTEQVWSCPVLQIRYEEGKKGSSTKRISKGLDGNNSSSLMISIRLQHIINFFARDIQMAHAVKLFVSDNSFYIWHRCQWRRHSISYTNPGYASDSDLAVFF